MLSEAQQKCKRLQIRWHNFTRTNIPPPPSFHGEVAHSKTGKCGSKPPVDSFATEPSQAGDDQHMADPERGQLNLEGAAEVVNQAKVLSKKNMKMLRKRPGPPKYVRHFVKLISELAEEHDDPVRFPTSRAGILRGANEPDCYCRGIGRPPLGAGKHGGDRVLHPRLHFGCLRC